MPLGLGCDQAVLPRGTVCDNCNHYFGRTIERDFLQSVAVSFSLIYTGIRNRGGKRRVMRDDQGNNLATDGNSLVYRSYKGESVRHNKKEITFDLAYKNETFLIHNQATSRFIHKLYIEMVALLALEAGEEPTEGVTRADPRKILRRYIRSPHKNAFRPFAYRSRLRSEEELWRKPFRVGVQTVSGVPIFFAEILLAGFWITLDGKRIKRVLSNKRAVDFIGQFDPKVPMLFQ